MIGWARRYQRARHLASQGSRIRLGLVGLLVASTLLAGCSSAPPTESAKSTGGPLLDRIESEAEVAGASDAQLEALADGEVTFAEYEQAVRESVACLRASNIDVVGDQVDSSGPFPVITYSYAATAPGLSASQADEIAQGCLITHSVFVEAAYQTGPVAVEAMDEFFEEVREEFVGCLEQGGLVVEPDASRDELERSAAELFQAGGQDCFFEAGLR